MRTPKLKQLSKSKVLLLRQMLKPRLTGSLQKLRNKVRSTLMPKLMKQLRAKGRQSQGRPLGPLPEEPQTSATYPSGPQPAQAGQAPEPAAYQDGSVDQENLADQEDQGG